MVALVGVVMYRVSKVDWQQAIDDILCGNDKPPYEKTAEMLGMNPATLKNRLRQQFEPEVYGELPPDFFYEHVHGANVREMAHASRRMVYVIGNNSLPDFNKLDREISNRIDYNKRMKTNGK